MITEYENTLRQIIIDFIGGDDECDYKVSPERKEKWKEKREIEAKKYNGINPEKRLIYYSDFYDLQSIIIKNWDLFIKVLDNKKRFEIFFSEIENYRNTLAHGRNLSLSQENLLNGIISDLKNQITIYHNKNEMKEDFFIRIIRVNDNLGNTWTNSLLDRPTSPPILRVGDEYEILIDANDPKGREIEYNIMSLSGFKIEQNSNRFNFIITNDLIQQSHSFFISAFTPASEYKNESTISINLTILPS